MFHSSGLMSYHPGVEVKQTNKMFFFSQEGYTNEILKKFDRNMCNPSTLIECGLKMIKILKKN